MKKLLRIFVVCLCLLFTWPFFLYKKYGNTKQALEGRTIIIANHYSSFDAFFVYLIFGRQKQIRFITITETKKKLWSRFVTWLFDCLYIDHNSPHITFIKQCLDVLNNDGVLCIFPEGYVNPRKFGFLDFRASYILLARKTRAKILPLYIYPTLNFLKYNYVYVGDVVTDDYYNQYPDRDVASTHIQSKVMDYSLFIDNVRNKGKKKNSSDHSLI